MRKRERVLSKLAYDYNRQVVRKGSGHFLLVCRRRERAPVYAASTPGGPRSHRNLLAQLRRAEAMVPEGAARATGGHQ